MRHAVTHLKRADPILAGVIERVGPCRFAPVSEGTHFDAVIQSIVYQQLSGKAAATIHGRLLERYGGKAPLPAELIETPDEALRAVGLSRQKLGYLKSLAAHVLDGSLPIETLHDLEDDDVVERLVRVKGIGIWTAQIFLMFRLGRLDVLPALDLGIQKGVRSAYRMRKLPTPKKVIAVGAKWAPYRSIASWYLWRSLELEG